MPIEAMAAALLSAVIHAAWNATLKAGTDRLLLGHMHRAAAMRTLR